MDYPVILARQTPHGMVAEAGQGKGKEGIRMEQNRVDLCLQSQAVHIHPAVKEGMETALLNQFQLATTHLHLKLSLPKVWKTRDKAENRYINPRSASLLGAS